MKIKEMQVGQAVTVDLVLSSATIRRARNGKNFLQMTLSDGTDKLDGKIWDYDATHGVPPQPKVYTVTGTIGEYNGVKQITVDVMSAAANQDMTRFSAIYYEDQNALFQQCKQIIDKIENEMLKELVRGFYTSNAELLMQASGAKAIHHAGVGGNLVHSLEVARLAYGIAQCMAVYSPDQDYEINTDLVIAGALMHDIGKAMVYNVEDPGLSYTRMGREQDHIILGVRMLDDYILHFIPEYYGSPEHHALVHIIASHHGSYDKGSPVIPSNMEAVIVNYADGLSATLNTMLLANRKALSEHKELTDKIWTMENRQMTLQKYVLWGTDQ